jgi:hypothetical protein
VKPTVVLTANDRPWYMLRTLESWRGVRGIGDALMIFQCEPHQEMVNLVCAEAGFAGETRVKVNQQQAGCSGNTARALDVGFGTGADFVVLGEDDAIVTADVLEYMAWGAERYRADPDVFAICTFQDTPPGPHNGVRRTQWFFPPVWGTWADRYAQVRDGWPEVDSIDWAHRLHAECMAARGQHVIQPLATRSQQIGEWGTYQRGSLQHVWDQQRFTAVIGPQEYFEIPGVWTNHGERIR